MLLRFLRIIERLIGGEVMSDFGESLENRLPLGHVGSNPTPSAIQKALKNICFSRLFVLVKLHSGIELIELRIDAALLYQLLVGARFGNSVFGQDQNTVGVAHGR